MRLANNTNTHLITVKEFFHINNNNLFAAIYYTYFFLYILCLYWNITKVNVFNYI